MYVYTEMRPSLFNEAGFEKITLARQVAMHMLSYSGAFRLEKAMKEVPGDSWKVLAAFDYLTELEEIQVAADNEGMMQNKVYVAGRKAVLK